MTKTRPLPLPDHFLIQKDIPDSTESDLSILEASRQKSGAIIEGLKRLAEEGSAVDYYQMGRSFHDRDALQEAVHFYHQAIMLDPSLAAAYNDLGTVCHSQGNTQEAIQWYDKAVSTDPSFSEAYYNLGNAYKDQKKWKETEIYSLRAAELDPALAEAYSNLGIAIYQQDRPEEAITCWQKVIDLKPDFILAHINLATAFGRLKRLEEAIQSFRKALALNPDQALPWVNLGNIHREKGEIEEAVVCYRKALTIDPSFVDAYVNLGSLAMEQGHKDGAIVCYRQALQLNPKSAEIHFNLANTYNEKGEIAKAIGLFQEAIELRPDYHQAYNNLALILQGQGRFEESIHLFNQALALNPDLPEVLNNLGNALKDQRKIDEAIELFRKAILLNPDYPAGHWNLSLTLLMIGCFSEGWPEYEWRWKLKGVINRTDIDRPLWDGSDLQGKRILLYAEQGFGDTIQFIRYVSLVIKRGGRVVLECQPELASLMAGREGIEEIIRYGEPLPDFDIQCPLLSLPLIFHTDFSTIPNSTPYLSVAPTVIRKWKDCLNSNKSKYRVGLVWAGKPGHSNDCNRSLSLEKLNPLARIPGVTYYSLQKGEAAAQTKDPPPGMNLMDVSGELTDFAETGGLIQNLDLIISADTSVAHLAGALGKPVWTLLPFSPDWRWLLDRDDTPWYPTMRLFRQQIQRDWAGVIQKVVDELDAESFMK